ncbi:MAG: pyridoxamine 5'-phosphate oxidase family protein [Acidobacteriota bacterium]|nr:pyridoxamine 5'-phosphate oxidase family protein [Acidobacteriota bacterium]
MGEENEREVLCRFLGQHSTLTLSTVGEDGSAYVSPLFYFTDPEDPAFSLYWFSDADSCHSRNLERDARVAVAVYEEVEAWREIHGVQMIGAAFSMDDRELRRTVTRRYIERFHLGNIFRVALKASTLYGFRPSRVRYMDNRQGFGYKREFDLP